MIICFNCSSSTKQLLDNMVEAGQYDDYGQAIACAIENLYILHREIPDKGSLIFGSNKRMKQSHMDVILDHGLKNDLFYYESRDSKTERISYKIPSIFGRDDLIKPRKFADLQPNERSYEDEIPPNKWIFGMYNKLLPAKANCRALAHLLKDTNGSVRYNYARSEISKWAFKLGDYLKIIDSKSDLSRDEALSTAFPISKKDREKSISRYLNQFLGNVNKEGHINSLLVSLKLINYKPSKDPEIMLTDVGWQFAELENPLLDNIQSGTNQKFSDSEINCMLRHISNNIYIEDYTYRKIILLIQEGNNTPNKLDSALSPTLQNKETGNSTKSFLSSQRSGAISRMVDLTLVERIYKGVFTSYRVTEAGKNYVK